MIYELFIFSGFPSHFPSSSTAVFIPRCLFSHTHTIHSHFFLLQSCWFQQQWNCVMKYVVKLPMIDCLIFKIGPFTFGYSSTKCKMIAKIHILMSYFSHKFKNNSELLCMFGCVRACLRGGCAHSRIEYMI